MVVDEGDGEVVVDDGDKAATMASAGSPCGPCGGPQRRLPLSGGHGGSAGRGHQREFRGMLLARLHQFLGRRR